MDPTLPSVLVVGPALAPLGLAPELGAGNVAEVAAKLAAGASALSGARREEVGVRLVLHHAAERAALGAFDRMGAGLAGIEPDGTIVLTPAAAEAARAASGVDLERMAPDALEALGERLR